MRRWDITANNFNEKMFYLFNGGVISWTNLYKL
jgi:hypothetical protein